MPDPTTPALLAALIDSHPDPAHAESVVWRSWEQGEIGSKDCRQLVAKARAKRAAARKTLAEVFEATVPAPEGVEAPDERDEEGNWRDGW